VIRAFSIAAITLMLIACSATESHDADSMGALTPPPPRPVNDLPPRSLIDAMPDFGGIGPLRFGMTAEQMRKTWGVPLYGEGPANDPQACHYLRPGKDDYGLLFMVEGDRFVRVDVKTDTKAAPGGGRVGMDAGQIEKLYAGRTTATPGKYDGGAKVLSIAAPGSVEAKLVFETDASGLVKSWRIGLMPQVGYVEGCG
jgi:hypothetical protein